MSIRAFNEKKIKKIINSRKILALDPDEIVYLEEILKSRPVNERFANPDSILEKIYHIGNYENQLLERLADLEHQQWVNWLRYETNVKYNMTGKKKTEVVNGWLRKQETPYKKLTKKEQESDREIARLAVHIMKGGTPNLISQK